MAQTETQAVSKELKPSPYIPATLLTTKSRMVPGDLFELLLPQQGQVYFSVIQAINPNLGGLRLKLQVTGRKESGNFGKAGYLMYRLKEIQTTQGVSVPVPIEVQVSKLQRLYDPEVLQEKRLAGDDAKISAVGTGASVGLSVIGLPAFPIVFAAKALAGTAVEFTSKKHQDAHQDQTTGERVGGALFRATGVPGLVRIVKKDDAPDFMNEQSVMFRLQPDVWSFVQSQAALVHEPVLPENTLP
ncbi:MAG: hypothetical protein K2X01_11895 [Cyanobacteria bacterium]|nr:hypothetical protein [Cyanobacteriota bacterium]